MICLLTAKQPRTSNTSSSDTVAAHEDLSVSTAKAEPKQNREIL